MGATDGKHSTTPTSGELWFDGQPVTFRSVSHASSLGIEAVYQVLALINQLNVHQNIVLPRERVCGGPLGRVVRRTMRESARQLLHRMRFNIPSVDVEVARLSGGQRQRVTIARSLVNDPAIVWADEPTGALDSKTAMEILELMLELNRTQGLTIVIVTHDHTVGEACQRIIQMRDGEIVLD